VAIDIWGRTSVPGLYACGEAAGGVQGQRRMMGTGLLEGHVFGLRAATAVGHDARRAGDVRGITSCVTVPALACPTQAERTLDAVAGLWLLGDAQQVPGEEVESRCGSGAFDGYRAGIRHRALSIMARAGRV
jgi:succinate dehydrogenase/fumarate reductase flavoprotein subunit